MVMQKLGVSSLFGPPLLWITFVSGRISLVQCASPHHHHHHHHHVDGRLAVFRPTKMFVFGDSYADTGNNPKASASSWKVPYGITFPGKPAGRYSDGRVLTDFPAAYFGPRSPIPYRWRKVGSKYVKYGMNFAFGGTGVFDTPTARPNMTVQIDPLQQLIAESVYTGQDLRSSLALVTNSGNDYSAYLARNGSIRDLPKFITRVVNQLALDIERIHGLGMKMIAIAGLQPLGCLPGTTASDSFRTCNATINSLVTFHNQLQSRAVAKPNNCTRSPPFVIVDLYTPFMSVLNDTGSTKFPEPLKPCCVGINSSYSCGSVDQNGQKKYDTCKDPKRMFFWDMLHPTREGWRAVFSKLGSNLKQS
ncbi:GDSL esterase/lipase At5g03610 isoform X2 [Rhodamnia argentea]|uniref:GDSL esterase/lipase At5g03610 isoform X1 n=1 Tax=Rhodamnia argentea TaxID=178133 RepID=A0A8B8PCE3_9MYRT|nr:GDSL esterase/lipase At5g03610 isoform X1 [Rhodamnia argentea]XP_048127864.1 GDSL esterase/lipase At5g03610 isoform X1 [Rhodamnia argentea]XP_048127865.1 GDSL esterase/lipase At5g03610 isoform X2 [Rhodamnia argentea]